MITYVDFSLFESPAKVLVNTVNTVGVMGKGIAKEFKRIYPEMFQDYQQLCERGQLDIGQLWLYKTPHKWVLNFPTKKHWRNRSKPEYIEAGLEKFVQIYQDTRITSISFPLLGCGNGELDWETQVKPLMEQYLRKLPIEIFIHLSQARSETILEHLDPAMTKEWLRSQPESLAFTEVWDDLVAVINNKRHFTTLDGKEGFEAETFDNSVVGNGIKINAGVESALLYEEQLLDLWQQVRDVGLCIPRIMPSGLDLYAKYILPLLAELPYLKPILQAENNTHLTSGAFGLLLKSQPAKQSHNPETPKQLQLV